MNFDLSSSFPTTLALLPKQSNSIGPWALLVDPWCTSPGISRSTTINRGFFRTENLNVFARELFADTGALLSGDLLRKIIPKAGQSLDSSPDLMQRDRKAVVTSSNLGTDSWWVCPAASNPHREAWAPVPPRASPKRRCRRARRQTCRPGCGSAMLRHAPPLRSTALATVARRPPPRRAAPRKHRTRRA